MNQAKTILALLVAAQTAFLCSTFRQWSSMGVIVALVMTVVWVRSAQRSSANPAAFEAAQKHPPRPAFLVACMVILLAVAMATRSSGLWNENPNFLFIIVDIFAHFSLMATLLLWALRPITGHMLMLFLGLALLLLCGAAGGATASLAAQTSIGLMACLGFMTASKIILGSTSQENAGTQRWLTRASNVGGRRRQRVLIATTIALLMVTGAVASVTDHFLPAVRNDLQDRLESTIQATQPERMIGGMRYVRGSRLGSIREHLSFNPNAVVLTIYSKQRPGYLRGTVFDLYEENRWSAVADQVLPENQKNRSLRDRVIDPLGPGKVTLRSAQGTVKLNKFKLASSETQDVAKFEIVGDPMRGNRTFLPLSTRWVEARSRQLTVNHHGVVRLGIDITRPYVAGAESRPAQEKMSANRRKVMTYLLPQYQRQLQPFSDEIFQGFDTTDQKAAAIRNHFQQHFDYGLRQPNRPPSADPLIFFLKTRHEAHCEYFATATVLLLRSVGVPARYATGYVSDEEGDESYQWVAKNRDAHAWAEAYDDQTQRWFAVETTPGRQYQAVTPPGASAGASQADDLENSGARDGSDPFYIRWWRSVLSFRMSDALFFVFRYSQIAVLVGLVLWWVRRLRRKGESELDQQERHSRKMLTKADRLFKKQGWVRGKSETLHHFADRVDQDLESRSSTTLEAGTLETNHHRSEKDETLIQASQWLRRFADARYQGKTPPAWDG